jgi:hypothetical protein
MKSILLKIQRALLIFLIVGQVCALVGQRDFFPFSPYGMYSQTYTPEFIRTHQVWLGFADGQRKALKIQNYYPALWNAAFIESLLFDNASTAICTKLAGFISIHQQKHPTQRLKAIEVWRNWLPWEDFSQNTLNQTKNYDQLQRKLLATCSAVAN